MNRNIAKKRGSASRTPAAARETASDRFEFARRHIIAEQKLEKTLGDAEDSLRSWVHEDEHGEWRIDSHGMHHERKPRTPDERAEVKKLESDVVDAKARLWLHTVDGLEL